ncbi:hypothetical protein [Massilia endophytica]|nr:hypothetical protein [Massilia endophytica]
MQNPPVIPLVQQGAAACQRPCPMRLVCKYRPAQPPCGRSSLT